ncbi:MAG: type transport system permease protein [Frankiales bacterium]|jgi:ABC-2 type transport system permease protein|nr:type transport system permease protein [Frankiales bacterium]
MIDTLHAEWTKLRTSAGTFWLLLAAIALTIGLGVAADAGARCVTVGCNQDPAKISLTGVYLAQVVVAVSAVTILGGEYGTGMIGITFTAVPNRVAVLTAKAIVAGGWALVAGLVGVFGSTLVGWIMLPGRGFTPANGYPSIGLSDAGMLRATFGSVLYLVLIALLSLGITAVVRDSAVAIGCVLGLLFVFPIVLVMVSDPHWHRHLEQISPMTAGLAIQATVDLPSLSLSPWFGLGVLGLWGAGALTLGALLLELRDA